MRLFAKALNTDDIEVKLEITMTVSEWRELMRQLPQKWPSWELGNEISSALGKLETAYVSSLIDKP